MLGENQQLDNIFVTSFRLRRWRIGLASMKSGLVRICFPLESKNRFLAELERRFESASIAENAEASAEGRRQIEEYFKGQRKKFDLPVSLRVTTFQRRVLSAVAEIPYGKTRSYGEIARKIGSPGAARAVGSALHANPLPLVIPCHRVIGSNGSLVGFGGGKKLKAFLLEHERDCFR